jgi:hypothetical protein
MIPLTVVWVVLAFSVLGLAIYRKFVARQEDDLIHIGSGQEKLVARQIDVAGKLDAVDKWGKILTIVTIFSGLIVAVIYLSRAWLDSLKV